MPTKNYPDYLAESLKSRKEKGLFRKLKTNFPTIDFCSNDYLGFSKLGLLDANHQSLINNPALSRCTEPAEVGVEGQIIKSGSTGSRLISGNSLFIEETEKVIAKFHSAESALIFNSGYDSNLGLFSSVPQKNDLVLYDELIHASIYDGIRLSYAKHYKFKHNDIDSLNESINRHKNNFENIYIAVESVYSMDGDAAPLLEIIKLIKKEKNIFLIVDEAHAIGIFGTNGLGLCNQLNIENDCFARVYTYGKAMGCHGAVIVGSAILRDYLINFARSFIYTTALPQHSIACILSAYKLLENTEKINKLQTVISYFLSKTNHFKNLIKSNSTIQCLVIGDNKKADDLENTLAKNNIYAKAIKSPTVKAGTERLRICLHAFNTVEEIDLLVKIITEQLVY